MSVRLVALVSLVKGLEDPGAEALALGLSRCADSVDEIERSHAGLHIPGSFGGDLTWDLSFESDASLAAFRSRGESSPAAGLIAALGPSFADLIPSVARVDAVVVEPIDEHVGRRGLVGIKRTLLFRVRADTPQAALERFERDMLAMPFFVPAIRNWCFGRPRGAGSSRWTHIWEQEFESPDGLLNDYMASPYHWGHIDAWYDPECPQSIVDPAVAHVYCPESEGVLSWSSSVALGGCASSN